MYLPAIVSVSHYFDKKRSFATGIAVCGSGIGTFIFAPVSKLLVDEYTWKGAVLIEAGIILNCILCGALFRPLVVKHERADTEYDAKKSEKSEKEKLMKSAESNGVQQQDLPDIQKTGTKDTLAIPNKHIQSLKVENGTNILFRSEGAINNITANSLSQSPSKQSFHRQTSTRSHQAPVTGPMYRKDIFYSGSLINIPQYRSNPNLYVASITSLPDVVPDDQDWCLFRFLGLSPDICHWDSQHNWSGGVRLDGGQTVGEPPDALQHFLVHLWSGYCSLSSQQQLSFPGLLCCSVWCIYRSVCWADLSCPCGPPRACQTDQCLWTAVDVPRSSHIHWTSNCWLVV